MKITKIETIPYKIKLKKPFREAAGVFEQFGRVIVKVWTNENIIGIGEVSPNVPYDDETLESALTIINKYLKPKLIGEDPFNIEKIIEKMDAIVPFNVYAKSGIDIALFDIMGKTLKIPIYKLLGGYYRERIPACRELAIAKPGEMAKEAEKVVGMGFKYLKVKMGIHPKHDVNRFKAVREAVGEDIIIAGDGNEGYKPHEAIKVINSIEKYDLAYLEQPVPKWDIEGLIKISKSVDTPVFADQSLRTLQDAMIMVKRDAVQGFNIKIGKQGGLYNSKKIAALAEAFNISLTLGTKWESGIAAAAGCHFAVSSRMLNFGSSILDGPQLLEDDMIVKPLKFEEGFIQAPQDPGLGIELDEEAVKKCAQRF